MTTSEVFTKCLPHTASLLPGVGGIPELTWQDVLGALQGIEKRHEGFIRYVHLGDLKGRHDFYAGLMTEACSRPDIQHWILRNPKKIDSIVTMAMEECKIGRNKYTNDSRAYIYGVSRGIWARRYQQAYSTIVALPAEWETDVIRRVKKWLRTQ